MGGVTEGDAGQKGSLPPPEQGNFGIGAGPCHGGQTCGLGALALPHTMGCRFELGFFHGGEKKNYPTPYSPRATFHPSGMTLSFRVCWFLFFFFLIAKDGASLLTEQGLATSQLGRWFWPH